MKNVNKKDLERLLNYILDTEWDSFLDELRENGFYKLTKEESVALMTHLGDPLSDNITLIEALMNKECDCKDQNHVYALARRLINQLNGRTRGRGRPKKII